MKNRCLFIGGPFDGEKINFTNMIPQRIRIDRAGKIEKHDSLQDCEWPFYSLITAADYAILYEKEQCVGKYIYVEQSDYLDKMLHTIQT